MKRLAIHLDLPRCHVQQQHEHVVVEVAHVGEVPPTSILSHGVGTIRDEVVGRRVGG